MRASRSVMQTFAFPLVAVCLAAPPHRSSDARRTDKSSLSDYRMRVRTANGILTIYDSVSSVTARAAIDNARVQDAPAMVAYW